MNISTSNSYLDVITSFYESYSGWIWAGIVVGACIGGYYTYSFFTKEIKDLASEVVNEELDLDTETFSSEDSIENLKNDLDTKVENLQNELKNDLDTKVEVLSNKINNLDTKIENLSNELKNGSASSVNLQGVQGVQVASDKLQRLANYLKVVANRSERHEDNIIKIDKNIDIIVESMNEMKERLGAVCSFYLILENKIKTLRETVEQLSDKLSSNK